MKKSTLKFTLLLLFTIIISSGCRKIFQIEGNYHLVKQERNVPIFNSVSVEGSLDVVIQQSDINNIAVEAESNLLPYILTDVKNGTLKIKKARHRSIKNHLPIKIFINSNIQNIESITLSGSGSIKSDSISINDLYVNLSGSGDIKMNIYTSNLNANISGSGKMYLSGKTEYSSLKISGSGDIKAPFLSQNTCNAKISGSGNMYIHVINYLNVNISGSGKVYYTGEPVVNTDISGSGEVIHNF